MGNTILFIVTFGIIMLILSPYTYATQPSLPTSLYGKVLDYHGVPKSGIIVTVTWTDSMDIQRTFSTKTSSKEEAITLGDSALEGAFLFNQGYLLAKPNTDIILKIDDTSYEKIGSNPGGITKTNDLILLITGRDGSTNTPSGNNNNDNTFTEGNSLGNGNGSTKTSQGTKNSNEQTNSQDTGLSINNSSGQFVPSKSDINNIHSANNLPTSIKGQLLDENNKPIENERVTVECTDEQGINHTSTTNTLTEKEAKRLGNSSLKGYYLFNDEILAKQNTTIKIFSKDLLFAPKYISSSPANNLTIDTIKTERTPLKVENHQNSFDKVFSKLGRILLNNPVEESKVYRQVFILFVLITILIAFVIYRRMVTNRTKKDIVPHSAKILSGRINRMLNTEIYKIMSPKFYSANMKNSLAEILEIMITNNTKMVVVLDDKKIIGIISEKDIIKSINFKDNLSNVKLDLFINKMVVFLPPDTNISNATKLLITSNSDMIIVVKNKSLLGIVTKSDLRREYNRFFSQNVIDAETIAIVKNVMDINVTYITKERKLNEMMEYMSESNTDYVVVIDKIGNYSEMDNVKGIVTIRDLLEEIYKNPDNIRVLKANNIMKSPIVKMSPGLTIIEANSFMFDNYHTRVPVVLSNRVVGIITESIILNSLYDFCLEIMSIVKNSEARIIEQKDGDNVS